MANVKGQGVVHWRGNGWVDASFLAFPGVILRCDLHEEGIDIQFPVATQWLRLAIRPGSLFGS